MSAPTKISHTHRNAEDRYTGCPACEARAARFERGFKVEIDAHTEDCLSKLDPDTVRHAIGSALDKLGIEEEIDYTLNVIR